MTDGKIFERDFKESATKQGLWLFRINDTFVKAREYDPDAFIPYQPCDYILHEGQYVYMLELKTTSGKAITIERDGKNGMIKKHQYDQMNNYLGDYEKAGFVLQFERGTDNQMTYYIPLENFNSFLMNTTKKSINRLDVVQNGGIIVEQNKVRTRYLYDIGKVISKIS